MDDAQIKLLAVGKKFEKSKTKAQRVHFIEPNMHDYEKVVKEFEKILQKTFQESQVSMQFGQGSGLVKSVHGYVWYQQGYWGFHLTERHP